MRTFVFIIDNVMMLIVCPALLIYHSLLAHSGFLASSRDESRFGVLLQGLFQDLSVRAHLLCDGLASLLQPADQGSGYL